MTNVTRENMGPDISPEERAEQIRLKVEHLGAYKAEFIKENGNWILVTTWNQPPD